MTNSNGNGTILVTGSTDGVGRRVAERLGAEGATILVHGRDRARAESVEHKTKVYIADLSSPAACDRLRALSYELTGVTVARGSS